MDTIACCGIVLLLGLLSFLLFMFDGATATKMFIAVNWVK
jgi:hypothetical protein